MKTALYRHFDKKDKLLYVGISLSAIHRLTQHKNSSDWTKEAVRMETEWFDSKSDALTAEREAIVKENPCHNVLINKMPAHKDIGEKYFILFSNDLKFIKPIANKQTLFFLGMLSRMDNDNVVQMTPYIRESIMDEIGTLSKDKLAVARQYLRTLVLSELIVDIGKGAYMVRPKFSGFSNTTSSINKKQERFIRLRYGKEGRVIEVGIL
jgi:predicted GIY-YIG superfamily endonuclease